MSQMTGALWDNQPKHYGTIHTGIYGATSLGTLWYN